MFTSSLPPVPSCLYILLGPFYRWQTSITAALCVCVGVFFQSPTQLGAVKRPEGLLADVVRVPCHLQRPPPRYSFPFHLECEIGAGEALTPALRGQLLKSDVPFSG